MIDKNEYDETWEEQEQQKEDKKKVKPTKFNSPIPFLRQFRNLVFGNLIPDFYTQLTFYMNVVIWTTFFIWDILGYFTLNSKEFIIQNKGVPIDKIIAERGNELGFEGGEFFNRLTTFHGVAIICWLVVFFGLILLYRKNKRFIYFTIGGIVFYIGMCIFYLGWSYFILDTTTFDKIALLIMLTSGGLRYYLMRKDTLDGGVGFFGETVY
jgi:hypothetical protein